MNKENTTVVIVGRPNVGKSTLFNKIVKKRLAIVSDWSGVTRDRNYARIEYNEHEFILVDTGGLIENNETIQTKLNEQTQLAINEADIIIFLVDSKAGLTPDDSYLANYLRKANKEILLVANKSETNNNKLKAQEFNELSLGEPHTIAAEHNIGIIDLKDKIVSLKPQAILNEIDLSNNITFSLIGKPNTGKSTLTNKLIGKEQLITSNMAGTTRDSIAIDIEYNQQSYTIVDTAGVRRKTKIKNEIEKFSVIRSLNTIAQSHVIVYLIDATDKISDQDLKLINFVIDEGKALIIAINKCDLLDKEQLKLVNQEVDERLEFASFAHIINISATTGSGIKTLWRTIYNSYHSAMLKMSTKQLTEILKIATTKNPPPMIGGRTIKMQLAHPGGNNPPTIIIHGKQTDKLTPQYKRYLTKCFFNALKLTGTPIRLFFKSTSNPFDK
ncbi:MAG: ribosome biogenesis GTPase Der [Legionellales bacterium]|mgnify:CR=1 FL=1|jgi:GTPase|nr:ribosome biogenesis GTPase Der [Legionellales bacterium]